MVVKEKRGRRRYIAFETDRQASDEEILSFFTSTLSPKGIKAPKMIQFDGRKGIFRCPPVDKERILRALEGRPDLPLKLITLSTSGTLKTLREKYFPDEQDRG
jgi:RNase P/RNase MRP subunit POP5